MIVYVALIVRGDMELVKKQLPFLDHGVAVLHLRLTESQRLDLRTDQRNPDFVGVENFVFVPRFAVLRDELEAPIIHESMIQYTAQSAIGFGAWAALPETE